jgi:hypothetical protein
MAGRRCCPRFACLLGPAETTFALSPSWSDGVTRDMKLAGEETFECDTREGSGGVGYELADSLQVHDDFTEGTVKVVGSAGTRELDGRGGIARSQLRAREQT